MAKPEPKPYIVKRDGTTDLAFSGWLLGAETDGWPEVRLYKSLSGKYIIDERDTDDDGERIDSAVVLNSLDAVKDYIVEKFGAYSDEAKAIFRQASSIEPSLIKYSVEEV